MDFGTAAILRSRFFSHHICAFRHPDVFFGQRLLCPVQHKRTSGFFFALFCCEEFCGNQSQDLGTSSHAVLVRLPCSSTVP